MRKAADLGQAYDSIVEFAKLDSFMDAPLRTYSSVMTARLAFAVATHRRADVLLVDEVLAVGDVHFQEKCRRRMEEPRTEGRMVHALRRRGHRVTVVVNCPRLARPHGHPWEYPHKDVLATGPTSDTV